ncbi:DNA-3-methyladenine glycosylase I [Putridiphycobacter roseus]|uniref:DNA-3-methyladenine glycosylase I n=1 Tax=Putridiphycobacter roseus TaxID=2219161 RepID=A0A2W1NI59_9FLAO|nr:DNA-3-methyladenine glycosylase I [Putridiphycobacter roseus]PZE17616.1 DNA-3-methyladenine glycosylase I [Putridiphycobacter roseus]
MEKVRCQWSVKTEKERLYHDQEWGVPVHDDQKLFEMLILEGAQAGLSWSTILNKREGYRKAFHHFDLDRIIGYSPAYLDELATNPEIVRNKLKIKSTQTNAIAFKKVQEEFGSFDQYIWRFVNHQVIQNNSQSFSDLAVTSPESEAMSKDLKKRGFKFVGSTIMYAYMQAVGMVNDHEKTCFRFKALS